jgi:hypothetical protein
MNTKPPPTEQEVIAKGLLQLTRKLEEMIMLLMVSHTVVASSAFPSEAQEHHETLVGTRVAAIKAQVRAISATVRKLKP